MVEGQKPVKQEFIFYIETPLVVVFFFLLVERKKERKKKIFFFFDHFLILHVTTYNYKILLNQFELSVCVSTCVWVSKSFQDPSQNFIVFCKTISSFN